MNYFTFARHFIIFNSFGNFTNSGKKKKLFKISETVKNNCCGYWD